MNILLAEKILQVAVEQGVREFCICAGARSAPFVFLLDRSTGLEIHHFFEERSAAFFALGRIQKTGKPVAVITTSGTAAAELLPAAIEATYTAKPLLLITADRPKRYRNTGAPQSIEQVGIFSHYVQVTFDIASPKEVTSLGEWKREKPIHINVCFEEPLIDAQIPSLDFSSKSQTVMTLPERPIAGQKILLDQPLVIVGSLPETQIEFVTNFLGELNAPIYAEALSGLWGEKKIESLILAVGEKSIQKSFQEGWAKSVLRIGGVPTLRFWRDLEDKFQHLPVVSISETNYSGLARKNQHLVGYENLAVVETNTQTSVESKNLIFEFDKTLEKKLQALMDQYPKSEVALVSQLSYRIGQESTNKSVYLGNSLPIREWDLAASHEHKFQRVFGNRGANGIDGQISTFLGWTSEGSSNWAIVGDLTAMYDLSALWISPKLQSEIIRIVIINNGGGKIFKNIFKNEAFLNRHEIHFQKWAQMWDWDYQRWAEIPRGIENLPKKVVIELAPDEKQSDLFWQEYQAL